MRELNFNSFLVNEGNRRAYELCLAISRGEPISPLPVVLVGESGGGKTHLLRATAQRLRATMGHAVIVLVSPRTQPEEIAALAADPKPVDMARYAVLLVDDIQAMKESLPDLAALVRIFIENDHPVVLASESHPDRLAKLPPELARIIRAGQHIAIDGSEAGAAIESIETRIRDEQREAIARLEERIQEMERAGPVAAAEKPQKRFESLAQLRRDLAEARDEVEHLRGENALLGVAAREAGELRKRIEALESERLERVKRTASESQDRNDDVKQKLDEARFDAQKAREEARGMLERAQLLLEELHKSRSDFESTKRLRDQHRQEIQKLSEFADTADRGTEVPLEDPGTRSPDSQLVGTESVVPSTPDPELTAVREEIHRLQESLVRARAERDNAKSHLTHLREELDTTRQDLDQSRGRAAAEQAEQAARIRELEETLIERHEEIEGLQRVQQAFAEEVRSLQDQVTDGAEALARLMELFGDTPGLTPKPDPRDDDPERESVPESQDFVTETEVPRPDFGDGIRLVPRRGPALHHIEEVRDHSRAAFPTSLPPLDDADEGNDYPQSRMRSA